MKTDTLDKYFSLYIRLRDRLPGTQVIKCIACGKIVHWKESDCGHFVNRKHISTRWHECNCSAQCRECNRFDEGNLPEYSIGIEKKFGKGIIDKLIVLKHTAKKYSQFEIKELTNFYKQKVKELEKL